MLAQTFTLIGREKGRPGGVVEQLQALQPRGTTLLVAGPRSEAVLVLSARRRGYPLRLAGPACAPAPFLVGELDPGESAPRAVAHCGRRWRIIAAQPAPSPGQVGWWLARDGGLASP
jgi:hypothetical protein